MNFLVHRKMKRSIFLFILLPFISLAQQETLTVYFKFNKYDLDSFSRREISHFIHDKKISHVSVSAHCDSIGNNSYNDLLSMRRAEEVKKYFISKNINESSIEIKASGKRVPLNKNQTPEERRLNRRAEIRIVPEETQAGRNSPFHEGTLYQDGLNEPAKANDSTILNLKNAEVGSTIKLENINFYGGRHVWLPRSEKTLRKLLLTMQGNPSLEIEIQGHICCLESGDGPDFDTNSSTGLSVNRAKAIYDYLVENGIDKSRLSYAGFGSDRKLVKIERTEGDRESNRRVEIMVVKK